MAGRGCLRAIFERALNELGWMPARLVVAESFRDRLIGMTGHRPFGWNRVPLAMGFPACSSVHTCRMRYPLDIAFLDGSGEVISVRERVAPWRFIGCRGAWAVLERAST